MTEVSTTMQPQFLGAPGERHFVLSFFPEGAPRAHIFVVPPFGEEMNRCRALVAQQARAYCENGIACTLIDFYGTGDSEGELCNARLQDWIDNIHNTLTQFSIEGVPVILSGLRTGALVAARYASLNPDFVNRILLWQPVTSGKRFVTQLLRQRVAALASSGLPAETTGQIREQLSSGNLVEVSGYVLGDGILSDLEQLELHTLLSECSGQMAWLENMDNEGDELSTATQKLLNKLQQSTQDASLTVTTRGFTGPPIWQLHKRDEVPDFIVQNASLTEALMAP